MKVIDELPLKIRGTQNKRILLGDLVLLSYTVAIFAILILKLRQKQIKMGGVCTLEIQKYTSVDRDYYVLCLFPGSS